MTTTLSIGLALALGGQILLQLSSKAFRFDSFSLPFRLSFWLLALAVLALAAYGGGPWLTRIGAEPLGWLSLIGAVVAAVATLAIFPSLQRLQKILGGKGTEQTESFKKIAGLSAAHRAFLVVTAAVVEEILYRGYGIGIGRHLFGNVSVAVGISLLLFVGSHFRWGISHLISVFWCGLVLSLLFVATNNLFACILAHFVIDAFGVLLLPWAMARKRAREAPLAHEH
ncbi:MAG TPA: CPBP family intramembrane glutamic endopeptidase [Longimicrobiales bacterium]